MQTWVWIFWKERLFYYVIICLPKSIKPYWLFYWINEKGDIIQEYMLLFKIRLNVYFIGLINVGKWLIRWAIAGKVCYQLELFISVAQYYMEHTIGSIGAIK